MLNAVAYKSDKTCRCCLRDSGRLTPLDSPDEMIDASTIGDALKELTNVQVFRSPSINFSAISQSGTVSSSVQMTIYHKKCVKNVSPRSGRHSPSGECVRKMMRNCVSISNSKRKIPFALTKCTSWTWMVSKLNRIRSQNLTLTWYRKLSKRCNRK